MTATERSSNPAAPGGDERSVLGRAVAARYRPAPRARGASMRAGLGDVAVGSGTMAATVGRSGAVRRALAVLGRSAVGSTIAGADGAPVVRPPRWWLPSFEPADGTAAALPGGVTPPGLPRVVRRVPTQSSPGPGGFANRLAPTAVPMRLPHEVAAAGSMFSAKDVRRRTAPRPSADAAGPAPVPVPTEPSHVGEERPQASRKRVPAGGERPPAGGERPGAGGKYGTGPPGFRPAAATPGGGSTPRAIPAGGSMSGGDAGGGSVVRRAQVSGSVVRRAQVSGSVPGRAAARDVTYGASRPFVPAWTFPRNAIHRRVRERPTVAGWAPVAGRVPAAPVSRSARRGEAGLDQVPGVWPAAWARTGTPGPTLGLVRRRQIEQAVNTAAAARPEDTRRGAAPASARRGAVAVRRDVPPTGGDAALARRGAVPARGEVPPVRGDSALSGGDAVPARPDVAPAGRDGACVVSGQASGMVGDPAPVAAVGRIPVASAGSLPATISRVAEPVGPAAPGGPVGRAARPGWLVGGMRVRRSRPVGVGDDAPHIPAPPISGDVPVPEATPGAETRRRPATAPGAPPRSGRYLSPSGSPRIDAPARAGVPGGRDLHTFPTTSLWPAAGARRLAVSPPVRRRQMMIPRRPADETAVRHLLAAIPASRIGRPARIGRRPPASADVRPAGAHGEARARAHGRSHGHAHGHAPVRTGPAAHVLFRIAVAAPGFHGTAVATPATLRTAVAAPVMLRTLVAAPSPRLPDVRAVAVAPPRGVAPGLGSQSPPIAGSRLTPPASGPVHERASGSPLAQVPAAGTTRRAGSWPGTNSSLGDGLSLPRNSSLGDSPARDGVVRRSHVTDEVPSAQLWNGDDPAAPRYVDGEWDADLPAPTSPGESVLGSDDLESIVERVIERIEQRVLDELERRGRRGMPGVL
ncbi:hypothetical protein G1H11_00165 [Phytoactinopolyspora alkaliphila]|uniref:Uncharacterized protein n=1 Tax=Phytoactinopolyspora alkaliphila TaxID=1783498 RepID=A0A6N9YFE5_9ACTN|nr:hypothetical protein [Phytoactinopolyspora alkaliphila]NED93726.1 hypothetical protein [Phytoactinopolyspora alkaliphila]